MGDGALDLARYDFLDLGCSRGGSIRLCRRRFGARRGLGIDLSANKVAEARTAGYDAVIADATRLEGNGSVRFVSMIDFLEHLPDLDAVAATLERAARLATDFLFIQHPSFEGEGLVEELGVRQYWWHWSGHTVHPQVADYSRILADLGLGPYSVRYRGHAADSRHPSVIPTGTRKNQQAYDPEVHPPKPAVEFPRPLWHTQEIVVALRRFGTAEWAQLLRGRPTWRLATRLRRDPARLG